MTHPLHKYVGFQFIQIMKKHRVLAEPAFQELGLYLGQEMALFVLWEEEGLTQTELGNRLGIDPSTVTKSVQRLQQAGIVERRQDEQDGRVWRVHLTESGRALQEPVQQIWDNLESQTIAGLSDVELALLKRLISQILENLSN